jgi:hypothetical protein
MELVLLCLSWEQSEGITSLASFSVFCGQKKALNITGRK